MKIPKKCKIGGHLYKIQIKDLADSYGETDKRNSIITLDSKLSTSQMGATFLHEVLHAINNEMGHELLDSLAEQLYQFLSENKLLK